MSIEDVILVATAREEIYDGVLRVDVVDIPRHIANAEAEIQQAKLEVGAKEEYLAEPNVRDSTALKAKLDAEAKAKAESEASETAKAEHEAKAEAEAEAQDNAEAEAREKWEAEASAKAEADAKVADKARAKAAEAAIAKTELEAKENAEKERLEIETESKAEAAKTEEVEKRVKVEKVGSRAKQTEEQIAKQRAMGKAESAAATSASSTMGPAWGSTAWPSKFTQAASGVSSVITPAEEPAVPPKSTILRNSESDMLSNGKNTSFPNSLPADGGRDAPQHSSTHNPTPHEPASIRPVRSVTVTPSSASGVLSPFTIVSEEHEVINDKQDGNHFQLV